jgi:hypothetical protein
LIAAPSAEPIEIKIDDWSGVERKQLTYHQPAGDAERPSQFCACALGEHQRQRATAIVAIIAGRKRSGHA